jgi:hypothetical protein
MPKPLTIVKIAPQVCCDTLDDPPLSEEDVLHDPFEFGHLASNIPNAFLTGHAYGRVTQDPGFDPVHCTDDDTPASASIDVKQQFVIDVYWDLSGPLVSAFSGSWAVTIFFDCATDADLDFQIQAYPNIDFGCPGKGCQPATAINSRQYHAIFRVPADTVQVTDPNRGTPYKLDVSIVLLNHCNSLPTTGIIGSVELEDVLFFSL